MTMMGGIDACLGVLRDMLTTLGLVSTAAADDFTSVASCEFKAGFTVLTLAVVLQVYDQKKKLDYLT